MTQHKQHSESSDIKTECQYVIVVNVVVVNVIVMNVMVNVIEVKVVMGNVIVMNVVMVIVLSVNFIMLSVVASFEWHLSNTNFFTFIH